MLNMASSHGQPLPTFSGRLARPLAAESSGRAEWRVSGRGLLVEGAAMLEL